MRVNIHVPVSVFQRRARGRWPRRACVGLILGLSARVPTSAAQATPLVEPTERVYRDLDRLASMGLIDTLMVGMRPFSEREIVRRLTEAKNNLPRLRSERERAEEMIKVDLERYRRDDNHIMDAVRLEATAMASPFRDSPSFGGYSLPALVNPIVANREGRPAVNGATNLVETMHTATIGRNLAVVLNPRATVSAQRGSIRQTDVALQSGYVRALVGDLSIEVGRDYAIFGQTPTGGLLLSTNAPPFDMVRIANDGAWRIPKLSSLTGPVRASLFVADLGARNLPHPHSKVIAYHLSMLPAANFELGLQVLNAMGGDGGVGASFGDRLLDAMILPLIFRRDAAFPFSNRLVGLDAHWRMPQWRGLDVYFESDADDFNGRTGALVGLSLACLGECGKTSVRAEFHRTGELFYTHWSNPISAQGLVLGDPLGPRAYGYYLTTDRKFSRGAVVAIRGAFESRKGETLPSERRARAEATLTFGEDRAIATLISGALERVWNFGFVRGYGRTNGLVRVGVVARVW
jgi:hypothetical protein